MPADKPIGDSQDLFGDGAFDDNGPIEMTPELAAAFAASPEMAAAFAAAAPAPAAPAPAPAPVPSPAAPQVSAATFTPLAPLGSAGQDSGIDLLLDVSLQVSVELGRARMTIGDILALRAGSVIELDKLAGEPADILINGTLIARGEVVVVDEKFGVRVLEVVSRAKRLASLA
jgi:flagellar motor switch protein FliN/FliY